MSYAIDVDILLYASDANGPMHELASAFIRADLSRTRRPLALLRDTLADVPRSATRMTSRHAR